MEINVLYKMSCDRCVGAIDEVDKFVKKCGLENKVSVKNTLIRNENEAEKLGFDMSLSPMIFVNGEYIGSGKAEVCTECSEMSGTETACGIPLNKEILKKMKQLLCEGIRCSC